MQCPANPNGRQSRSCAVLVVSEGFHPDPTALRTLGAKARILETADELFYSEGIRAVGVDRLISESQVTKATFYKHFGSKDALIVQYIEGRHESVSARLMAIAAKTSSPQKALQAITAAITGEISRPGFRGDPFLNAAAEYPESAHPVRSVVLRHREWYTDFLADLLQRSGHERPGDAADDFVLARDGAFTGAYAGDPIAATAALLRACNQVLAAAS
jgi:AcrR family transcriptional regulator